MKQAKDSFEKNKNDNNYIDWFEHLRATHRIHSTRSVWRKYGKDEDAIFGWTTVYVCPPGHEEIMWKPRNLIHSIEQYTNCCFFFFVYSFSYFEAIDFVAFIFILCVGTRFYNVYAGSTTISQNDFMRSVWAFRLSAAYFNQKLFSSSTSFSSDLLSFSSATNEFRKK